MSSATVVYPTWHNQLPIDQSNYRSIFAKFHIGEHSGKLLTILVSMHYSLSLRGVRMCNL